MFEKTTPEKVGIKSKHIADYISYLNRRGIAMHDLLLIKGNNIFGEFYWAPFHKAFLHRQYSQTKSFVAVAIGLLEEEGKICLDDKICDHFPEKITVNLPEFLKGQTIKQMLMMQTSVRSPSWFLSGNSDRTNHYLNSPSKEYPSGTLWEYDSPGSQVLSSLVEKLSGVSLFEYLKTRLFDKMGFFKNACILKTPNGDSWGDSALICTPRDMAAFGRLVLNYGIWNGQRLMNEEYLKTATSPLVSNRLNAFYDPFFNGYGYQIWCTEQNGFAFNGMGGQFTICLPDKDIIMVCNGDNQGYTAANSIIINGFFDYIVNNISNTPLPENKAEFDALELFGADLKLVSSYGRNFCELEQNINNKTYKCADNPMGIESFSLDFNKNENSGTFTYKNRQGTKEIAFGMGYNVFGKFPQYNYSKNIGGIADESGYLYNCASSAGWIDDKTFMLRIQIIDIYFGNLCVIFSFKDSTAVVKMVKNAENFLNEYNGILTAEQQKK